MKMVFKEHIAKHQPYIGGSTRSVNLSGMQIHKLSSNENLLGPSPLALAAIHNEMANLHEYQHQDDLLFRNTLSKSFDHRLDAGQFLCANSGMELLDLICRAFLSPGDEAILSTPTFLAYKSFIEVNGAIVVDIPLLLPNYSLDVEGVLLQVNAKTKLLFISSPNNPTGAIVTKQEMCELMAKLPEHVIVIYDEVYYHFVENQGYARALDYVIQEMPVIGLHSFSKAYGLAGIRLGYAFASKILATYLRNLTRPFMINSLSMAAGAAALSDKSHIQKTRKLVSEQKIWMIQRLSLMGIRVFPSHANYLFFIAPYNAEKCCNDLLEQGIMIRTGRVFGAAEGLRVTIGTHEANRAFVKAMEVSMAAFFMSAEKF